MSDPTFGLLLLGTFHATLNGSVVHEFQSNSVRGLLAYLAVESDRTHERSYLAELFWPDDPTDRGLTNLRQALHRLTNALEATASELDPAIGPEVVGKLLHVQRNSIRLNPQFATSTDVRQLIDALERVEHHPHRRNALCAACRERLTIAIELYRGEFLSGFSGRLSASFDQWLRLWRDRTRALVVRAVSLLVTYHEVRGDLLETIRLSRRWIELEPWNEEASQRLIDALAQSGQRSAALAQYERCRQTLAIEFNTTPSIETMALVGRIQRGRLVPPHVPPFDVPSISDSLVGRGRELTQIDTFLAEAEGRLLTIVGAGGSGKTRLAIGAAHQQRGAFVDGIIFVALEGVGDVASLRRELFFRLGAARSDAIVEHEHHRLGRVLAQRQVLLILDGCELLPPITEFLAELLTGTTEVTVIATSRRPLRLMAERLLVLDGLTVDSGVDHAAELSPAAQLFVEQARRTHPSFEATPDDLAIIGTICSYVEGLPLAIILAAGQLDRWSVRQLWAMLQRDSDVLSADQADVPPRHRSVRALFSSAWQALHPPEQRAMAALTVFSTSYATAAASLVITAADPTVGRVELLLSGLIEKTMLQRHDADRLQMHALVRQFVDELVPRVLDDAALRRASDAHSRYYIDRVEGWYRSFSRGEATDGVPPPADELTEIIRAWHRTVANHDWQRLSAVAAAIRELTFRIGANDVARDALTAAIDGNARWDDAAPRRDARARLLLALAAVYYNLSDYGGVVRCVDDAMQQAPDAPLVRATALLHAGKALWRRGDLHAAVATLGDAGAALDDDARGESRERAIIMSEVLHYQSLARFGLGEARAARSLIARATHITRTAALMHRLSDRLSALGLYCYTQGEFSEARSVIEESLRLTRSIDRVTGQGIALLHLGTLCAIDGDDLAGHEYLTESIRLFQRAGDIQNLSTAYFLLGAGMARLGDLTAASRALDEGLALCRQVDHAVGMTLGMAYRAWVLLLQQRHDEALIQVEQTLLMSARSSDTFYRPFGMMVQGQALAKLGRTTEAALWLTEAIVQWDVVGSPHLTIEALIARAELAAGLADHARADHDVARATELLERYPLGVLEQPARAISALLALLEARDAARATSLRARATEWFTWRSQQLAVSRWRDSFASIPAVGQFIAAAGDAAAWPLAERLPRRMTPQPQEHDQ
ncbi:MAG: hypothetical protein KGS47_02050 [Chloroflexi bacterium]|nr:hypothetical protein [Chloroflexota bacterium]